MSTQQAQQDKPLPTIWRVSDELWGRIEPILNQLDPPAQTGARASTNARRSMA